MRCECSSTRQVNKLSLHPLFVDVPSVQIEINCFNTLSSIQRSLIKSIDLSRQALSESALAETLGHRTGLAAKQSDFALS